MTIPRIGIVGAGQLARMMAQAAADLPIALALLAERRLDSAVPLISDVMVGSPDDRETVERFAAHCDVLTFDHEQVPPAHLARLEEMGVVIRPGARSLLMAQDKAILRRRLERWGVAQPRFRLVADQSGLADAAEAIGWPVIVKTARGGYDGHGVWRIDDPAHLAALVGASPSGSSSSVSSSAPGSSAGEVPHPAGARSLLPPAPDGGFVVEEFVRFTRELSIIVCRGADGQLVRYPLTETVQAGGVCAETFTPALAAAQIDEAARTLAEHVAAEAGVVGLLAIELMESPGGELLVNEVAMRPHNTGHWTIDGAITSQFENHLRAVAGLPLGDPGLRAPAVAMSNVFGGAGDLVEGWRAAVENDPAIRVHLYGKEPRAGRKLGHVTVCAEPGGGAEEIDRDAVAERARRAAALMRR
ncbi:MAG: 5-(carboxyamino)imidazole ribonucleotide synthase [Propionibacteriaceae bacterium]|nr:5-(carboxyamino)imidazole ribonucleotide synthase [Propionibacteriaceae bacterium]